MTRIRIDYSFGTETGTKYFESQDEATKFCEDLYAQKLKRFGFTMSQLYTPESKEVRKFKTRELRRKVTDLPRFKAMAETPIKINIVRE